MPVRLIRALAAAALLLAGACESAAPPVEPPRLARDGGYPFRSAMFHSTLKPEGSAPVGNRVWISPGGQRIEIDSAEGIIHVLRRGGDVYRWSQKTGSGISGPAGRSRLSDTPDVFDVFRELPFDLNPHMSTVAARERIGDARTLRYDFHWRDPVVKQFHDGSVWILEDRAFPVRYLNRGFGGHYEIVNTEFLFDVDIPAGFFIPPSDVRFTPFRPGPGRGAF